MKKIIISNIVVLFVVFCFGCAIADEAYTARVNSDDKIISFIEKDKTEGTKELKIVLSSDLPKGINKADVAQKLALDGDPEYLFQENHEIRNIASWIFHQGSSFRITYEKEVIVSEKMETVTDPELSSQIKKSFYVSFIGVLLSSVLAVAGGALLFGLNYSKIGAISLLFAVVLMIKISHGFMDTFMTMSILLVLALIGVIICAPKLVCTVWAIFVSIVLALIAYAEVASLPVAVEVSNIVTLEIILTYAVVLALESVIIHVLAKKQIEKG